MKAHKRFLIPKRIAGVSIPDSALAIEAGGPSMKIVIIGGSGPIGTKLVKRLREAGHEVMAASPDSGVNTITGEGLTEALAGAQVVVDVANSPSWQSWNSSRRQAATLLQPKRPPARGCSEHHHPS